MAKYSRKLEVVDALQYTGSNRQELEAFAPGMISEGENGTVVFSPTPSISFVLAVGDWVLKNAASAYYQQPGATFDMYYKPGGGP